MSEVSPIASKKSRETDEFRHFQWGGRFHETCQYNFFCEDKFFCVRQMELTGGGCRDPISALPRNHSDRSLPAFSGPCAARAEGGVGLLITEVHTVHEGYELRRYLLSTFPRQDAPEAARNACARAIRRCPILTLSAYLEEAYAI